MKCPPVVMGHITGAEFAYASVAIIILQHMKYIKYVKFKLCLSGLIISTKVSFAVLSELQNTLKTVFYFFTLLLLY